MHEIALFERSALRMERPEEDAAWSHLQLASERD